MSSSKRIAAALSRDRSEVKIVVFAMLVLAAVAVGQIQRQGDDLLEESRPIGCDPASLTTLTPGLWGTTSSLELARAVETWQLHNLEAAGDPVQAVALCAGRRAAGTETPTPLARRFTTPRHIYQAQLGWLSAIQVIATTSALLAAAYALRSRVPLIVTGLLTVIGGVAWLVERATLAAVLDRAWFAAQANGLVNPITLDLAAFNLSARIRILSLGSAVLLLGVAVAPKVLGVARSVITESRGVRLAGAAVGAFSLFVTMVPQADDAVRRWDGGQALLSFAVAVGLAVAFVASTARRPTVIAIGGPGPGSDNHHFRWLLPAGTAAVTAAAAGLILNARGLLVLAGVLVAIVAVSVPLARSTGSGASVLAPATIGDCSWPVGLVASLPVIALGLVAVRVAATDHLILTEPTTLSTGVLGIVALLGAGPLANALRSLHLRMTEARQTAGRQLASASTWAVATLSLPVLVNWLEPLGINEFADVGVIPVFFWFVTSVLTALMVLRALGDWLLTDPRWWRAVLPPALVALGLRRSPFPALFGLWIVLLPLVGPQGYHDVDLASRGGSEFAPPLRHSIDDVARDWVDRQDLSEPRSFPALSIASSGGGIRSAYWTAAVLDCIVDGETVGGDPCAGRATPADTQRRRDSLILLSGVSGGSLGLVSYVAQTDQGWRTPTGPQPPRWYDQRLGADFQATVLAHMVTGDTLEYLLRTGDGHDRARVLEQAFEAEWPSGELSRGFLTGQSAAEPFLYLSGYSAVDGCRFNLSILDASPGRPAGACTSPTVAEVPLLHGTDDLADYLCGDDDLRRSTIALASARFPYITPSGRLQTEECHGRPAAAHIVDGGYRGSSGAAAIADLWPTLRTEAASALADRSPNSCVEAIHVQIDNGELNQAAGRNGAPNEALLPIVALGRVGAGEDFANRSAVQTLFEPDRYFTIQPIAHPGDEAPLGWTLSETARADLQDQLRTNRDAIETIRELLDEATPGADDERCPEIADARTKED